MFKTLDDKKERRNPHVKHFWNLLFTRSEMLLSPGIQLLFIKRAFKRNLFYVKNVAEKY